MQAMDVDFFTETQLPMLMISSSKDGHNRSYHIK